MKVIYSPDLLLPIDFLQFTDIPRHRLGQRIDHTFQVEQHGIQLWNYFSYPILESIRNYIDGTAPIQLCTHLIQLSPKSPIGSFIR